MVDIAEVNWGILGCANIAQKNARGIILSIGNKLKGIATRSLEKGVAFMTANEINPAEVTLYTNYEDLIADSSIDAIYVPLPTTMHLEWVPKIAAAGKHILCEKPVATNASEIRTLLDVCNQHGVIFMDGVMFMHHKRLVALRKTLSDPLFGAVKRVQSQFSFHAPPEFLAGGNIRASSSHDPLGALGDLGWYCIRFGLVAFSRGKDVIAASEGEFPNIAVPKSAIAVCNSWSDDGIVPLDCEVRISFGEAGEPGGIWSKALNFSNSFHLPFRQYVEILAVATRGYCGDRVVSMDDFVIPRMPSSASYSMESFPVSGAIGPVDHRLTSAVETFTCPGEQEIDMFTNFATLIRGKATSSQHLYWQQMSWRTQVVVDACMESMRHNGAEIAISIV